MSLEVVCACDPLVSAREKEKADKYDRLSHSTGDTSQYLHYPPGYQSSLQESQSIVQLNTMLSVLPCNGG